MAEEPVYLSLGSNLGRRERNLAAAVQSLGPQVRLLADNGAAPVGQGRRIPRLVVVRRVRQRHEDWMSSFANGPLPAIQASRPAGYAR